MLSILQARELGLRLPIVYNTSAFDSSESLDLLDGLVDIYLPDFKVWSSATSKRLLKADDYAGTARESIKKMYEQVGDLCFTSDGIAKRGLLVRHLVMPGKQAEGVEIMCWIGSNLSRDTFVNIMEQYHPDAHVGRPRKASPGIDSHHMSNAIEPGQKYPEESRRYGDLNRYITPEEISIVREAAEEAGLWRFCDPPRHEGFNI